jgi:subtilisin
MKTRFIFALCLCLVLAGSLTFRQLSARMQSRADENEKISRPSEVDAPPVRQQTEDSTAAKFDKLIEKAAVNGSSRVIVGLRSEFRPEGELSAKSLARQRGAIREAQNDLLNELSGHYVAEVKNFDFIPFIAFEADAAALEKMKNSPLVASVQEDVAEPPTLTESLALIGASGGASNGFSGSGQTIAVLDTGVDKTHLYFSGGKVVSEACYSTTAGTDPNSGSSVSVCPAGAASSTAANSGLNCDVAVNGCFHGTHVAGIAAGRYAAGNQYGAAKDASIIAVQVFSRFNNSANCSGGAAPCVLSYVSDQIKGLERVYALRSTYNIAAVNMSLGGGSNSGFCDGSEAARKAAIDNLRSANIATVISSGNNGFTTSMGAPACISTAVSVGSTGDGSGGSTSNAVSSFSNSSSALNLLAPGAVITSAYPGNLLAGASGTSMAAPHVAGAWAILKQQNPNATVSDILAALTSTGRIVTDTRSGANGRMTPRIRLDAASQQLAGTNCAPASIAYNQFANSTLDSSDCSAETGFVREIYTFSGNTAFPVAVSMTSTAFDAFLYLLDPNGRIIASDDNSAGGTNARIPASGNLTLPSNGTYTIIATRSGASGGTGSYTLNMLAPTAGGAIVSGRVLKPNGAGVANAYVRYASQSGEIKSARTNPFGYFRFTDVAAGATYVFEVRHKRFSFAPQVVAVYEDLTDGLEFVAE